MDSNCVFCGIVRGELPSFKIYEDDQTLAILDTRPINPGHTLVIPKNSKPHNIFDVSPEDWTAVMETVRKLSISIEKGIGAIGVNMMMNTREAAGQLVDHVHVHVIPRFRGDGLPHWPQHTYKEGEPEDIVKKIRAAL